MELGADPDDEGNLDVWQLFRHYDKLYFRGVLINAGFSVEWSHPRMKTISSFGSCSFGESNTIILYEPILKYRTNADLKNALLHLMIHAFLSVKYDAKGIWGHGPAFRDWMYALNTCSIDDRLRPTCGYCITTTHDFSPEKCGSMQGFLWKCESCGVTLLRAKKLGPPSDSCCIENVSQDATCGNMLCNWHNHKLDCGGTYMVAKSPETPGRRGFLTEMSEMLRSQGAAQESDSDEFQENFTVAKIKAESKLLSQVGGRNARSPGSSSSKKASKSNMPEDFQKAIVFPASPRRKLRPKQEPFSMVNGNNAKSLDRCSSKKADDFQKAIVPSAAPPSKLMRKQTSVSSEKHELISLASCNNAKSSRSNTSRKAEKWHELEHVQKSSVQPSASQKKPKLQQDLGVSEKYGVFSPESCNTTKPPGSSTSRKADKRHTPEGVEKSSVPVAAPHKKLKIEPNLVALQQNKTNSSIKAGKKLNPEDFQKTFVQPALSQKKLKLEPDLVALEKHGDAKPLGRSTGNKEGKHNQLEGIQKVSVLPADPPRKLKHDLVASQKNELYSFVGRSNANLLDNISSKEAHKQRGNEETQKPIAQPAAPKSILKQQGKTNFSTKAGHEEARKPIARPAAPQSILKQQGKTNFSTEAGHEETQKPIACPAAPQKSILKQQSETNSSTKAGHEETQKPIVWTAAPQKSILKQQSKTNSSTKAGKQQLPEYFQRRSVQPGVSGSKLKQSNCVAPGRPNTRSKASNPARKKVYGCVSVWQNIYESECSSGSAEPLVNKRTERRRRERERAVQITYSRSRKRGASGMSSIKAEEEVSSQQTKRASQCLESILMDAPHKVATQGIAADKVMTRAPADESQLLSAPCSIATDQVVPPRSADPLSLTPSSNPYVIDISDDD